MGDNRGRQIDFHVIVLDEGGITPEWLVRFHTGYQVDANDWADVSALCARFDIPIPAEYRPFHSQCDNDPRECSG